MRGKSLQTAMLLCGARWERGPFPRQNPPGGIGHPGTAGSGSAAHGRGLAGTVSPRSFAPAHPSMPTTFLLPGISASPPPSPPLSPRWLDTWRDAETVWPVVFQPDGRCSASNGLQFWAGACRDTYALLRLDARWILIRQWEAWRGGERGLTGTPFWARKRGRPLAGAQEPVAIGLPRPYRATKTPWQSGTLRMGQEGQSQSGHFFFWGWGWENWMLFWGRMSSSD